MKLTKAQARRFLLRYQRLSPPRQACGKPGVLGYVRRAGCIQFDPLDQVGCNPHLVLQSRVSRYRQAMLNELLYRDRLLVDGFDKQLSVWPVEDWPCFMRDRTSAGQWYGSGRGEGALHDAILHVRDAIAERGALCSADFETREKVAWPWGPTNAVRAALESMYFRGELVVHHKAGTRKYYDLAEKHISPEILSAADPNPGDGEHLRWRVLRRIGSVGLLWDRAGDVWLGIPGLKSAARAEAIAALTSEGKLICLEVEDIGYPFVLRRQDMEELELSLQADEQEPHMAFIAPLDNLIWDRKLLSALFGFEYRWEVYTPQNQRKYGYYVLPVLYGDRFVARVEPKFSKITKTLELRGWWWEDGVKPDAAMKKAFKVCLKEFSAYLGAKELVYTEGYQGLRL